MPSSHPNVLKLSIMPPTVPCPPSKPISIRLPNTGGTPKSGVSTSTVTPMPTAYIPQATICPKQSCSATERPTFPIFGNFCPMNIVTKTMLMRNPGMAFHPSCHVAGMRLPHVDSSARPSAPPMIDDGRYSLRRKGTAVRIALPQTSSRHSEQNEMTAVMPSPYMFPPFFLAIRWSLSAMSSFSTAPR